MSGLNSGFRPRFVFFLPRGFALILGIIPRLNIDFRFALQSYTLSRLTIVPFKSMPMARAISVTKGSGSRGVLIHLFQWAALSIGNRCTKILK